MVYNLGATVGNFTIMIHKFTTMMIGLGTYDSQLRRRDM
jgi:hypothetical protein